MSDKVSDELASIRNELLEMGIWIDNDGTASQIVTGDELRAIAARINSATEAQVRQAFLDGISYASMVEVTDPELAWQQSRARAALLAARPTPDTKGAEAITQPSQAKP